MDDRSRFTYMTLDSQEFGIDQEEYDAFIAKVDEQRRLLEREHGEPWVALLDDDQERDGRRTKVVFRLIPVADAPHVTID